MVDKKTWETVTEYALALFDRGQSIAKAKGLILADTKYEFGVSKDGVIILGDEIHTSDSSRYWVRESYADRLSIGQAPETLDKDVLRRWLIAQCNPYTDPMPAIPDEVRLATSDAYLSVYKKITGQALVAPERERAPVDRIKTAIRDYLRLTP